MLTKSLLSAASSTPNVITGSFTGSTVDVGGLVVTASGSLTFASGSGTVSISISGTVNSQYRINSGAWTSASGTIAVGDVVTSRST
jgi:hypothetical protein